MKKVNKMSKYLLEIGVEELPYVIIPTFISQLKTNFERGLTDDEAEKRKEKYGLNKLLESKKTNIFISSSALRLSVWLFDDIKF